MSADQINSAPAYESQVELLQAKLAQLQAQLAVESSQSESQPDDVPKTISQDDADAKVDNQAEISDSGSETWKLGETKTKTIEEMKELLYRPVLTFVCNNLVPDSFDMGPFYVQGELKWQRRCVTLTHRLCHKDMESRISTNYQATDVFYKDSYTAQRLAKAARVGFEEFQKVKGVNIFFVSSKTKIPLDPHKYYEWFRTMDLPIFDHTAVSVKATENGSPGGIVLEHALSQDKHLTLTPSGDANSLMAMMKEVSGFDAKSASSNLVFYEWLGSDERRYKLHHTNNIIYLLDHQGLPSCTIGTKTFSDNITQVRLAIADQIALI